MPGDIVLLDNLRSHKVAGIAEVIAAREAQLIYLPPYSPDLNPIEQAFANTRRCCARRRSARSRACGRPLAASPTSSRQQNAATSLTAPVTQPDR
jgi:transposase